MVKVAKIAAYSVDGQVVTDLAHAEKLVRTAVIREVLDANMSFAGITTEQDVAQCLSEHWGEVERKMVEAMRGI